MFAIPSWLSNSLHVNGGGREKKKKKIPSPEMEREDRGNPSQQVRYIEGNNDPKEEEEGNSDDKAPTEDQLCRRRRPMVNGSDWSGDLYSIL